jgi:hypothetical protein
MQAMPFLLEFLRLEGDGFFPGEAEGCAGGCGGSEADGSQERAAGDDVFICDLDVGGVEGVHLWGLGFV